MRVLADAWDRFWFTPTSTATLAAVRVAFGAVVLAWALSLAPDLFSFFSEEGVLPAQPSERFWLGLLDPFPGRAAVVGLYALLLAAAAAVVVGYHTRAASVLVFVGILSFQRRNMFVFNSGDLLLLNVAFFLCFAPGGVALSVDRWRRARHSFWTFPVRPRWALRLVQIQLSVVYLATVAAKLRGTTWGDGTAVSYALRLSDLTRISPPGWLSDSLVLGNIATYATVGIELALGTLVWNRRARPYVLLAGIVFHLVIEALVLVGFFTLVLFVCYLAFVPADTMEGLLLRLRAGLAGAPLRPLRRLARAGPSPVRSS